MSIDEKITNEMNEITARLREVIEESGLSYAALHRKTGIAKSSLQRYATGQIKRIPIENIQKIADACNASARYIMGWEEPSPVEQKQDELFEKRKLLFDLSSKATEEDLDKFIKMLNVMLGEE